MLLCEVFQALRDPAGTLWGVSNSVFAPSQNMCMRPLGHMFGSTRADCSELGCTPLSSRVYIIENKMSRSSSMPIYIIYEH